MKFNIRKLFKWSKMTRKIIKPINELEEGMVLGEDIYNATGQFLLKQGETLTQDMISWLERLSVPSASIAVKEDENSKTDEEVFKAIKKKIDLRFARVNEIPHMCAIRDAICRHLAKRSTS